MLKLCIRPGGDKCHMALFNKKEFMMFIKTTLETIMTILVCALAKPNVMRLFGLQVNVVVLYVSVQIVRL